VRHYTNKALPLPLIPSLDRGGKIVCDQLSLVSYQLSDHLGRRNLCPTLDATSQASYDATQAQPHQEYNVVLAGYVGSVVVPRVLVSAFPIRPITNQLFNSAFLGSRVCFQLNKPLPSEVILVLILLRGNELNKLNGLITHHSLPITRYCLPILGYLLAIASSS